MVLSCAADFENGKRDDFVLDTPELGQVTSLVISQSGKGWGAAWYLEKLELLNKQTGNPGLLIVSL